MNTLWCNGQWVDVREFPSSPLDRGATLGLGLFETLLALDGRPVFGERHLARLAAGCDRFGWKAPQAEFPDLPEAMGRLLEIEGHGTGRARLRLAVSGGSGVLADLASGGDRLLWMAALPMVDTPGDLAVNISPWTRNERGALAGLKCASYAENLVALDHARRAGFGETLFFNTAGDLCEAATANVFLVRQGVMTTPSLVSGCLAGVTREVILELAARHDIPCRETRIQQADLDAADEVFITSATRGPVAVARVGGRTLPPPRRFPHIRCLWESEIRR
jgi:branched-subunit amino acid aminotransferase/4-amino-4-deoxychorismate lyase